MRSTNPCVLCTPPSRTPCPSPPAEEDNRLNIPRKFPGVDDLGGAGVYGTSSPCFAPVARTPVRLCVDRGIAVGESGGGPVVVAVAVVPVAAGVCEKVACDATGDENLDEKLENHEELRLGGVLVVELGGLSAEALLPKDGRDRGIVRGELVALVPFVMFPFGVWPVATFSLTGSGVRVGFGSGAAVGVGGIVGAVVAVL
jgi:hypothetical protein